MSIYGRVPSVDGGERVSVDKTGVWVDGDAAWDSISGNCGIGWLIRDSSNTFTESSSVYRCYVPPALVAEALAVKAAMTAAISSYVSSLLVCSDSKTFISLLKFHGPGCGLERCDLRLLSNKLRHKLGGVSGSRPWMVRRSHVEGGDSLRFQVLEEGGGFLLPQKSS
uniref:RNase H type-1 domain-containing protein n=1 Tax=Brassica oleracea var. oleracea TaxID=109376 RepID=A0A0D3D255_BRAOL